jgi:hypothetical protein
LVLIFASMIPAGCRGDNYRKKWDNPNNLQCSFFSIAATNSCILRQTRLWLN